MIRGAGEKEAINNKGNAMRATNNGTFSAAFVN